MVKKDIKIDVTDVCWKI